MEHFLKTETLPEHMLREGIYARLVHTEQMTVAHVLLIKGAVLPVHNHVHEQVTNVVEGELEMTVDGHTRICRPGDVVVLPSNVPHGAVALTECRVIDVFQPVREDYRALDAQR